MPRLSIIVPYRHDDLRMETTILSVLENRPRDCEVIVVHDGSYEDPYNLDDEVVYVEESRSASISTLLNAGLMAACSPVVCVLMDGVSAVGDWAEPALQHFQRAKVSAVAPLVQQAQRLLLGLNHNAINSPTRLQRAELEQICVAPIAAGDTCVAPIAAAGFYRRKVMLALGGWAELSESTLDVELAIQFADQQLVCECEALCQLTLEPSVLVRGASSRYFSEAAAIAVVAGLVPPNLLKAASGLIGQALSGRFQAARGWAQGLTDRKLQATLSARSVASHERAGAKLNPGLQVAEPLTCRRAA